MDARPVPQALGLGHQPESLWLHFLHLSHPVAAFENEDSAFKVKRYLSLLKLSQNHAKHLLALLSHKLSVLLPADEDKSVQVAVQH